MDARDPAKVDDEGAPLTVISGLTKEATSLFQNRLYSECVDVLGQILLKKPDDPKVLHNIAIAEFYKSGCSDLKSLLAALKSIKKKSEELTHVSTEDLDDSSLLHQMASESTNSSYSSDHDTSIITLNTAIIHYYLHDYALSASLLKPLYTKLQPLDEMTAIHVCILLIDVALASNNASDAAEVIQYMEKSFNDRYSSSPEDNGNSLPFQPSLADNAPSDPKVTETPFDRMLSEDAIEYEILISTLDNSSGQGLTRSTAKDPSLFPPAPSTDLKLKILLYKVKLLLLTRNLKTAKREIKLGMNGRDSSVALILKAHLEYSRGNHRKAVKLLTNLSANADRGLTVVLNNNLGCVLHHQRSYETSLSVLHKALGESNSLLKQRREKTSKFTSLSPDKSPYISYNCGIQFLMNAKLSAASTCFNAAVRSLGDKPLLWLRLAECCIGPEGSRRFYHWAGPLTIHIVGSGKWRRLVIKTGAGARGQERETRHTLSLPFARECLQNALLLLDELVAKPTLTVTGKVNVDHAQQDLEKSIVDSSVAVYEGMMRRENGLMRQAALADLAYVELTLKNPVRALTAARELQSLPGCSRIYSFFSRVYAAEALLLLDRTKEAVDQISVYVSDGNGVDFPYMEGDGMNWMGGDPDEPPSNGPNSVKHQAGPMESKFEFLVKPREAQETLMVNLGVLSAVEGDLAQARVFLGKVLSANPNHPHALLVAAYVDLREGATSAAASKLKRCSHVRFL